MRKHYHLELTMGGKVVLAAIGHDTPADAEKIGLELVKEWDGIQSFRIVVIEY